MHPAVLVLVIGILWWGFVAVAGQDKATRQRWREMALGAGTLVLLLFLLRIGLPGLALAGGGLWALVRLLAPKVVRGFTDRAQNVRDRSRSNPPIRPTSNLTRAEALEVLGLDADATSEQVQRAHRELMKKIHPDVGGTAHLAAQVNRARDVLLHK